MPADNPTGSWYVWLISIFLFLSIVSGGAFLVLYMTQPESPATSWYPIIGITLVCLPWLFWLLTCLYRILSRTFGFRMVCFGNDVYPIESVHMEGGGSTARSRSSANRTSSMRSHEGSRSGSSKQVHFGGAVIVNEPGNHSPHGIGRTALVHSDSQDSDTPLKLSMAS